MEKSLSTILVFVASIVVIIAAALPMKNFTDTSRKQVVYSASQLALSLSDYLAAQTGSKEQLTAFETAKSHLSIRLNLQEIDPFVEFKDELSAQTATKYLQAALRDVSKFFGFELKEIVEKQKIAEYIQLINEAAAKPNMLNLIRLNSYVVSHEKNFSPQTVTKAGFHRWLMGGIILTALAALGLSVLFSFRKLNVVFLAVGLLSAILALMLFMIITPYSGNNASIGASLLIPANSFSAGSIVLVLGALLFAISAFSGITSSNWLMAIVVYLIVIMLVIILYLFFKSSFIKPTDLAFVHFSLK